MYRNFKVVTNNVGWIKDLPDFVIQAGEGRIHLSSY